MVSRQVTCRWWSSRGWGRKKGGGVDDRETEAACFITHVVKLSIQLRSWSFSIVKKEYLTELWLMHVRAAASRKPVESFPLATLNVKHLRVSYCRTPWRIIESEQKLFEIASLIADFNDIDTNFDRGLIGLCFFL